MDKDSFSYPKIAFLFALIGMFIGAMKVGFSVWQGYFLGLPFFLIGNLISGLLTGYVVFKTTQYGPMGSAKRSDKPGIFWFAIFMQAFIAWWLISFFNEFSASHA